jgi:hypothetical protein
MPKKHVPHVADQVEDVHLIEPEVNNILHMELKGAGENFDAKANEARWEKYYLATHPEIQEAQEAHRKYTEQKEDDQTQGLLEQVAPAPVTEAVAAPGGSPSPSGPSAGAPPTPASEQEESEVPAEKLQEKPAAEPGASPTQVGDASFTAAASAKSTAKGKTAKPKVKSQKTTNKLSVPAAAHIILAEKKFQSVAEWKAKQAPKLVKSSNSDIKRSNSDATHEREVPDNKFVKQTSPKKGSFKAKAKQSAKKQVSVLSSPRNSPRGEAAAASPRGRAGDAEAGGAYNSNDTEGTVGSMSIAAMRTAPA